MEITKKEKKKLIFIFSNPKTRKFRIAILIQDLNDTKIAIHTPIISCSEKFSYSRQLITPESEICRAERSKR